MKASGNSGKKFQPKCAKQKSGIIFSGLKDTNSYNNNLFSTISNEEKREKLMKAIDYTNAKYGRHSLSIAQAGLKKNMVRKKRILF